MKSKKAHFAHLSSAKRWVILACLLLMTITVAAQALHSHPNELANDAKHCTVCQVAHAPVQVASTVHVTFGFTTTALFIFSHDPDPQPVLASCSLFCRPPPLG